MRSSANHRRHIYRPVLAMLRNKLMDSWFATTHSVRSGSTRASLALAAAASLMTLAACGGDETSHTDSARAPTHFAGVSITVQDTLVTSTFEASGIAEPMQQATLSTKLMGTVQEVLVHEGDAVRLGQPLLRIDARELAAKAIQVASQIEDAKALQHDATLQANRMRALYADSAATRAQLDAAESGLVRANAGVRAAMASSSELEAMSSYATVRAPFDGIVVKRLADAGTLAAPGTPLLAVQDISSLRISASVAANGAHQVQRGQSIDATIDGVPITVRIEGVVPANAGNLYTVNAILPNSRRTHRAGSAAVLFIPTGVHQALLVPLGAIVRDGDLTGVIVRGATGDERRWIRLGTPTATHVEVTSGLRAGEEIVVPTAPSTDSSPVPPDA